MLDKSVGILVNHMKQASGHGRVEDLDPPNVFGGGGGVRRRIEGSSS